MRTCKACGCYIPDLWGVCPGCGAIETQKSDSVGRFAPDRYELRGGRGNQILIQFPDPEQPTPAWTYRSTGHLETCSLDSRTLIVTAEQAHLETELRLAGMGYGSELSKIQKPPPMRGLWCVGFGLKKTVRTHIQASCGAFGNARSVGQDELPDGGIRKTDVNRETISAPTVGLGWRKADD